MFIANLPEKIFLSPVSLLGRREEVKNKATGSWLRRGSGLRTAGRAAAPVERV